VTTPDRGPIVLDTDVFSADLSDTALIALYEPIIVGRPAFVSFQTVAELRYGALRRGWGDARLRKLDAKIAAVEVVHSGDELVATYARLRADCVQIGHALGQREHDADR
jgi:predicted nucleic acid-binding protein